jgi:transcriptional regulator with XRE-family HTH domain
MSNQKPCNGCGGPKDMGQAYRYCSSCVEARRRCIVCGNQCPPERRTCSPECLTEQRASQGFRAMAFRPPRQRAPLPSEWRCSRCGEVKSLTVEHFAPEKRNIDTGEIVKFARWCKPCKAAAARERHAQRTAEEIERDRIYNRAAYELRRLDPVARERDRQTKQAWRKANRERMAEASRRYYARLKSDPERHARRLVADRIAYRLKQEQRNRPVRRTPKAVESWKPSIGRYAALDPEPLIMWLTRVMKIEVPDFGRPRGGLGASRNDRSRTLADLAAELGVSERHLTALRIGERAHITLGSADQMLTNYGRPVTIRSRDLERQLIDWAQELPGNGTRLLRYLDRAERVAHLADVSVWRIEDLWPELENE